MKIGYFTLHDPKGRLPHDLSFTGKVFSLKDGFAFVVTSSTRPGLFGLNCRTTHRNFKLFKGGHICHVTRVSNSHLSVVHAKGDLYTIGNYCPTGERQVWTEIYTSESPVEPQSKQEILDERPFPFELPDFGDLVSWSSNRFGTVAIFNAPGQPQRVYYWQLVDSGKKRPLGESTESSPKRTKKD